MLYINLRVKSSVVLENYYYRRYLRTIFVTYPWSSISSYHLGFQNREAALQKLVSKSSSRKPQTPHCERCPYFRRNPLIPSSTHFGPAVFQSLCNHPPPCTERGPLRVSSVEIRVRFWIAKTVKATTDVFLEEMANASRTALARARAASE